MPEYIPKYIKGFTIRLEPELRTWLEKRAFKNLDSLSGEINSLLKAVKNRKPISR